MKRVYFDVVNKYVGQSENIARYCKDDEMLYDFDDEENFLYDFDDGFVVFVECGYDYFANCGFLEGANAFEKCRQALKQFFEDAKDVEINKIYAKVNAENMQSSTLITALGFEQVFKIYEYKGAR